jgi:hypothetical protein
LGSTNFDKNPTDLVSVGFFIIFFNEPKSTDPDAHSECQFPVPIPNLEKSLFAPCGRVL